MVVQQLWGRVVDFEAFLNDIEELKGRAANYNGFTETLESLVDLLRDLHEVTNIEVFDGCNVVNTFRSAPTREKKMQITDYISFNQRIDNFFVLLLDRKFDCATTSRFWLILAILTLQSIMDTLYEINMGINGGK
jgi:hypothetical protein